MLARTVSLKEVSTMFLSVPQETVIRTRALIWPSGRHTGTVKNVQTLTYEETALNPNWVRGYTGVTQ